MIRDVLHQVLPSARVRERKGALEVDLPGGPRTRFRVISDSDEVGQGSEPSLLWLDHPHPQALKALRDDGISYVTSHGQVFLTAPGIHVDVRPHRSISDPDRMRNPFSPRGRLVCVMLLLQPDRGWTVTDLALASTTSQSFVSRVTAGLEDQGLIESGSSGLRPLPALLFAALAENWPKPRSFYDGHAPHVGEAVVSGGPAYEKYGLAIPAIPRIYVADRTQLRGLVVRTNSTPATSRMAAWEAVLQPLPLHNVIVPELICALELARDPRGREVLRTHPLVPWPIYG